MPQRGFSNQIGLILEPVARGLGFAVLPRFTRLVFARPAEIAVATDNVELVDTIWLIHRAEWPLSARAQQALRWLSSNM
ncbi:LysR substrate-binding domain-containing protein [Pantoea sp. SOD02]|uniref:LysR substrate-binding domain-containing protein n=1 Tax=Pantoea sp. SOD02 TaxID=2970818 RepID=UPI00280C1127|nr:LysR substrate-binding domain-containing protein [Pantoea sp. SOD02]